MSVAVIKLSKWRFPSIPDDWDTQNWVKAGSQEPFGGGTHSAMPKALGYPALISHSISTEVDCKWISHDCYLVRINEMSQSLSMPRHCAGPQPWIFLTGRYGVRYIILELDPINIITCSLYVSALQHKFSVDYKYSLAQVQLSIRDWWIFTTHPIPISLGVTIYFHLTFLALECVIKHQQQHTCHFQFYHVIYSEFPE